MTHIASRSETPAPTALLAEDDELIRELVRSYLERLGFEILEARNGQEALEIVARLPEGERIDLIVTDLLMPKADGSQVIDSALQNGICERFLVISGNPLTAESRRIARRPGSEYLEKPFNFGAFQEKLNAAIRSGR